MRRVACRSVHVASTHTHTHTPLITTPSPSLSLHPTGWWSVPVVIPPLKPGFVSLIPCHHNCFPTSRRRCHGPPVTQGPDGPLLAYKMVGNPEMVIQAASAVLSLGPFKTSPFHGCKLRSCPHSQCRQKFQRQITKRPRKQMTAIAAMFRIRDPQHQMIRNGRASAARRTASLLAPARSRSARETPK